MNVRIAQVLSFISGAWTDEGLEMNHYDIKLWMVTRTMDEDEQSIAFQRMRYFVEYELDNTVFVDESDENKCNELFQAGLKVMTMPGTPSDQMIGLMLYHKLNAIMEERIAVVEIEISANNTVIYLHGENEISVGLEQPDWWQTPDLVHSDLNIDDENIVRLQPVTNWRELDLAWKPNEDTPDTSNTVVFANFKSSDDTK